MPNWIIVFILKPSEVMLCAFTTEEYLEAMEYFGDSALKEIVISEGDLIGALMKGKTMGDGRQVKVVKENGTNIVVRIIPE